MGIGETFLSAFLQVLFEKLLSPCVNKFMQLFNGGLQQKNIKQLEKQLRIIEAIISDVEQKQLQSNAVKSWMQDLQDLAYDLEDVLDCIATQAQSYAFMMIHETKETVPTTVVDSILYGGSKVKEHVSYMFNIGQAFSARIEEINEQLKEILSQTERLGLSVHVMNQQTVTARAESQWLSWRESSSLLREPYVYERDSVREQIIYRLLNDENSSSESYVVIPIVGMGGIGKTTLAQLIYNSEEVNVFDLKAWVHVSQVFDAKKLTTLVLNSLMGESNSFSDLNQAQIHLKQLLAGKRFLIVLDDMWSEKYNDWDVLRTPLRAGAKGSKVLVTTRSQKVAKIMNPQLNNMISVELLSDECCWHLILQHAFDDANIALSSHFSLMRDDMVRKCKGLPLVAKALGGLLRTKVNESEWQEILSSDILSMSESGVLQVLELSYYDLPSRLKRCFAYCSLFPYDYAFREEEFVLLWMAEGFLPENVGNKQMEDIGHEYFHDLVSKSIFGRIRKGSEYFKMHSLHIDLAQRASGDLCLAMNECSRGKNWWNAFHRSRHLSFCNLHESGDCPDIFSIDRVSQFHTFVHFNKHIDVFTSNSLWVFKLLRNFDYIRVLSLPHMGVTTFPECVGDLKLLRYINFSHNKIEELPLSVGNLVNLQTLLLNNCDKLQILLANMSFLINLRHIDINGTSVHEMPLGIGNLTNLQTLQKFVIGKNSHALRELKNLNNLRGKLMLAGLENVATSNDAREAKLHEKTGLHELEMIWEWGNFNNGADDHSKIDVLDHLEPPKSTKMLILKNYKGVAFPNWLGNPSFSKMVIIRLIGCQRCETLAPLGKLPLLKELVIQEMHGIKTIDCDFLGSVGFPNHFPSLRTFELKSLTSWETWLQSSADNKGFPCLIELTIKDCPSLQHSFPSCLPRLQRLIIEDCSCLLEVDQLPMTLQQVVFSSCAKLMCIEFKDSYSSNGEQICLESIEVVNCHSLSTLFSKNHLKLRETSYLSSGEHFKRNLIPFEEGLCPSTFTHLTKLTVSKCPYLISFPEDLILPGLQNLLISVCENFKNLPNQIHSFTSLHGLILTNCPNFRSFPTSGLPKNLKSLYLDGLSVEQPIEQWKLHNLTSLEMLSVSDAGFSANEVYSFPNKDVSLPSSLTGLAISGFPNLESISGVGISNLCSLYIRRCPKLECLVDNYVPAGLTELCIVQCPVLSKQMEKDPLLHSLSSITNVRSC